MNSRERMFAALEGRDVDVIPVAPYFWGAEYAWKLLGLPIWEVLHGEGDMRLAILEALDERHRCDWVIPLHHSTGRLKGKSLARQDDVHAYFIDSVTGEEYVFHKEGHWLVRAEDLGQARVDHEGADKKPPTTKAEADDWLRRAHPHVFEDPLPHTPDRSLRDRFPERFLCGGVLPPFACLAYPMGFEPTMLMLHDDPSLCAYIIERIMVHVPEHCAALAADGFDGVMMVDSFASADIMSPRTYTDWIGPLHKVMSDEIHRAGLKSIMYNTGNLLPLFDGIRAHGWDAITLEERIKGVEMDIGEVRRILGPQTCVFGNFDAYLLMRGDREAIRAEVRRQISAAGPKSFVMGTGSPICDATTQETIDFWIAETRGHTEA